MTSTAQDLRSTVSNAAKKLRKAPEKDAATPLSTGKWSPKQIIGHLIDSASNNHQRFVRAQFQDHLRFNGYDQEAWVTGQKYQDADWNELITLWEAFNLHLARVMEAVPEEILLRQHRDHNLDQLAWEVVPASEGVTLEYFMRDYIGHLKHHLRQIDVLLADKPVKQRPDGLFKK